MDTTNTLSIFVRHGDVTHEMRSATCWACQETVNLVEDDWTPVRIGGDSANGYEPGHRNCRGIIAERQERRIEELERDLENIISGGSEPGHRNCRGIIAERQERRIEELERDLENIISGGSR